MFSEISYKEKDTDGLFKRYLEFNEINNNPETIPKKIHQIYWDFKGTNLPPRTDWLKYTELIKNFHPDFEYKLWNKQDCDYLIKTYYETYYDLYIHLPNIMKTDFARICIIHYSGGIYLDMDIFLKNSLKPFFNLNSDVNCVFFLEDINYICNASFAAKPKHYIIENLIVESYNQMKEFFRKKYEKNSGEFNNWDILFGLGPHFFTKIIEQKFSIFKVLDLKNSNVNYNKYDLNIDTLILSPKTLLGLGKDKGTIFGEHCASGSWK